MKEEYIKKSDAMDIVKRTHGDYATAWCMIRDLPSHEIEDIVETLKANMKYYSDLKTYTESDEYRREGKVAILERLLDLISDY